MTEVSVVFPSQGNIDVQNRESVEEHQEVSWRVQSFNPAVTGVRIRFEDPAYRFFTTVNGESHESPERALSYSGAAGQEFATATIYGRAPEAEVVTSAKYSVIGTTAGAEIKLDPVIVIHPEPSVDPSGITVG